MARQAKKKGHKNRRFIATAVTSGRKSRRGKIKRKRRGTNRHPV